MSCMRVIHSNSIEDTERWAKKFVEDITYSYTGKDSALVVGLSGELGSGKTTFMKGVAKAFGVTETVTSPTFVIEKIYPIQTDGCTRPTLNEASKLKKHPFERLIHIDAYRLEEERELLSLGWEEIKRDPKNIIFIEWPERVKGVLPKSLIKIEFDFVSKNERKISIKNF